MQLLASVSSPAMCLQAEKKKNLSAYKFTHLQKRSWKRGKKEKRPGLVKSNAETDTSFLWVKILQLTQPYSIPFIFYECLNKL